MHLDRGLWRSRWAAIGAAIAVTVGAGTVIRFAAASDPIPRLTFTPVTPCRLFDTKPGIGHVGARGTSLGPGETFTIRAAGLAGSCDLPSETRAVALTVTVLSGSSLSSLYVWPAGALRPRLALITPLAAKKVAAQTIAVSSLGELSFYNSRLRAHIAVDITGYYLDVASAVGATGETGVPGATGPVGPTGERGIVGASGPTGPVGATGGRGSTGSNGSTGPTGQRGDTGAAGAAGAVGAAGAAGP